MYHSKPKTVKPLIWEHYHSVTYVDYYTPESSEPKHYQKIFYCYINHRLRYIRVKHLTYSMGKAIDWNDLVKKINNLVNDEYYKFINNAFIGDLR